MFRPKDQKGKSLQEPKQDEGLQFCWGPRTGAVSLYESFTLDGIEYSLYDCVYLWRVDQVEPDIGKLVRIWETDTHEKKVEVVWFFRPSEVAYWLGDIKPLKKEIFLACGIGKGLSNLNPLETVSGKCNVVCTSKHKTNPQPTKEEVRTADYIFYRTFDVGKYVFSENFPSLIGGFQVNHFFNKRKGACPNEALVTTRSDCRLNIPNTTTGGANLKRPLHIQSTSPSDISLLKKRKLQLSSAEGPSDDALPCALPRVSGQDKYTVTKPRDDGLPCALPGLSGQDRYTTTKPRDEVLPCAPPRVSGQETYTVTKPRDDGLPCALPTVAGQERYTTAKPRDDALPCAPPRVSGQEKYTVTKPRDDGLPCAPPRLSGQDRYTTAKPRDEVLPHALPGVSGLEKYTVVKPRDGGLPCAPPRACGQDRYTTTKPRDEVLPRAPPRVSGQEKYTVTKPRDDGLPCALPTVAGQERYTTTKPRDDALPCAPPRVYGKVKNSITKSSQENRDLSTREEKIYGTNQGISNMHVDVRRKPGMAKLKRPVHIQSTSPSDINPLKKRKLQLSSAEGPRDDALPRALPRASGQEKYTVTKPRDDGLSYALPTGSGQERYTTTKQREDALPCAPPRVAGQVENSNTKSSQENRDLSTPDEKRSGTNQHLSQGISNKYIEVRRKPGVGPSKWLKPELWTKERLSEAEEKGTLVLLENIDPSFTSVEVEDLIWTVFEQIVKAKMVQHTAISSPHYGQALVLFKTKEAATNVILELFKRCLVLGDGRPISARKGRRKCLSSRFCGHLSIDRSRAQRHREALKNVVATSHCAQGNTIEYEMATEWWRLQEQSDRWWNSLHEEQG